MPKNRFLDCIGNAIKQNKRVGKAPHVYKGVVMIYANSNAVYGLRRKKLRVSVMQASQLPARTARQTAQKDSNQ